MLGDILPEVTRKFSDLRGYMKCAFPSILQDVHLAVTVLFAAQETALLWTVMWLQKIFAGVGLRMPALETHLT